MEWIVIDDGEDCVKDLFENIKGVKYFRYEEKLKLGKKRNLLHLDFKLKIGLMNLFLALYLALQ